jgi:hypothetical protein
MTLTSNEPIYAPSGWTDNGSETSFSKVVSANVATTSLQVSDMSNNIAITQISVWWIDKVNPIISITGANPAYVEVNTSYSDLGATFSDSLSGIQSSNSSSGVNINQVGTYAVVYTAQDKAGNIATATRTVIVRDTTPPVIILDPTDQQIHRSNVALTAPELAGHIWSGVSVEDNYDISIATSSVSATWQGPTLDITLIGNYIVRYSVLDSQGNTGTATRTITVVDESEPVGTIVYYKNNDSSLLDQSTTWTNQSVKAVLTLSEPISSITSGWTSSGGLIYYKVFNINEVGTVNFYDPANNLGSVEYNVYRIDRTSPVILAPANYQFEPNANPTNHYATPTPTIYDVGDGGDMGV